VLAEAAVKKDRLSHPYEEAEKMLLRIGEPASSC
jgi:hypothetical protein